MLPLVVHQNSNIKGESSMPCVQCHQEPPKPECTQRTTLTCAAAQIQPRPSFPGNLMLRSFPSPRGLALSAWPLLALPPALAWPGSPFSPALCRVLGRRSQLAIAQPAVRSPGLRLRQLTFPAMPGPQRSLSFAQLGPAARHQSSASAFHALSPLTSPRPGTLFARRIIGDTQDGCFAHPPTGLENDFLRPHSFTHTLTPLGRRP